MDNKDTFRKLHDLKAERIALQFPDGLKTKAISISEEYCQEGFEPVVFTDPCYGACDLLDNEAKLLGCDAVVQFGHSEFKLDTELPYIFQEVRLDVPIKEIVAKSLENLGDCKAIGLITTVQHIGELENAKRVLENAGKKVFIGKHGWRTKYDGQVQGCDFESAASIEKKVDVFLYIGSGNFHPLGVSLYTGKKVIIADPLMREVREIEKQKDSILRQRFAAIELAKKAEVFGVVMSTKKGQLRAVQAEQIRAALEKKGKKAYLLAGRELTPENLEGIRIDVFVNTACPRLALDDYKRFKKPVLSPPEIDILLGKTEWNDYEIDNFNIEV